MKLGEIDGRADRGDRFDFVGVSTSLSPCRGVGDKDGDGDIDRDVGRSRDRSSSSLDAFILSYSRYTSARLNRLPYASWSQQFL